MDVNKKARTFRGLKIAFYILGVPLFVMAVIVACIPFFGEAPFVADSSSDMFATWIGTIAGTGMYGVWLAFGAWAIIALISILCGKALKSFRAKAIVVVAFILVVMLGSMFAIDTILDKGIQKVAENAPEGVVVKTYKNQLAYYRTTTSDKKTESHRIESYTDSLEARVDAFMNIYNVPYYDQIIGTKAVNGSNVPIKTDYYKLKNPGDPADAKVITAEPNAKGHLVLDGVDYGEQFYYLSYTETTSDGKKTTDYVWYDSDYRADGAQFGKGDGAASKINKVDGVYGKSYYNKSGLLTDATLTGVETSLEILKQYYESYNFLQKKDNRQVIADVLGITLGADDSAELQIVKIVNAARAYGLQKREDYYTVDKADVKVSDYATNEQMYNYEIARNGGFEITGDELDVIIAALGKGLGAGLSPILSALSIIDIGAILGDALGVPVSLTMGATSITITVNSTDYVIDENLTVATLEGALNDFGIDATKLADLVGGLLGVTLDGSAYTGAGWLKAMVLDLLKSLYWFSSPVLLPEFDETFLTTGLDPKSDDPDVVASYEAMVQLSKYMRALYEGQQSGGMKGSTLIGKNLGAGSGYYAGSAGFTELEVLQLQTDLSYQPKYYPIMAYRDMCVIFAGIAVLFTILYYRACERALNPEYAKGKKVKKEKKEKKAKEKKAEEPIFTAEEVPQEEEQIFEAEEVAVDEAPVEEIPAEEVQEEAPVPVEENTEKEDK